MSTSTSRPSASRVRVPPLSYALHRSSLGPQLHGPETGPMLIQGQDPQRPPEPRTKPKRMKTRPTCSTSWEGAGPYDQEHQTCDFSLFSSLSIFSYFCPFMVWQILLSVVLLFPWCADITVFSCSHDYCFQSFLAFAFDIVVIRVKSKTSSSLHCMSRLPLLTCGRTYFTMMCPKREKIYVCKSCVLSFTRLFK